MAQLGGSGSCCDLLTVAKGSTSKMALVLVKACSWLAVCKSVRLALGERPQFLTIWSSP